MKQSDKRKEEERGREGEIKKKYERESERRGEGTENRGMNK